MSDIAIRIENTTGRITLNRPAALNALTYDMCMAMDSALRKWRTDDRVTQVMIDAAGGKAFCAGGDIAELYRTGKQGGYAYGRRFWRDEYRMNAMIANYPKHVVSFLQGFVMGGGVGIGCHGSQRIVGDSTRIAMPECGIGLVPDVGGSQLLSRMEALAPGLGAWIGATGHRLEAGNTLLGFADIYQPDGVWDDLKAKAVDKGTPPAVTLIGPPSGNLSDLRAIGAHFSEGTPAEMAESLRADPGETAQAALRALMRASPLSVACHIGILRRLGPNCTIEDALRLEYRFTWRAMEHGDFLEGIRAQIIDKDRTPRWRHASLVDVTQAEIDAMLAPLGEDELTFAD